MAESVLHRDPGTAEGGWCVDENGRSFARCVSKAESEEPGKLDTTLGAWPVGKAGEESLCQRTQREAR